VSKRLLPLVPADLVVEQVLPTPDHLTIMCRSRIVAPICPGCGQPSSRRHSSYPRRLADLPWQGRRVQVEVQVRRLRCGRAGCARRIFAERLPDAAGPYAQRTARLGSLQHHIGLALGGKAGARLAERIGTPVSGTTLLRLVRRGATATPSAALRVLGVDDWAWKRGQRYGTVLVDLERHAVVDLLPDREADSFAAWLQIHPGIEVIARDRGASYADGGRRGAPDAVHVADRWHLLKNCSAAVLEAVKRHMPALRAAAQPTSSAPPAAAVTAPPMADPDAPPPMTSTQRRQWQGWQRRVQVHGEVMRLHKQGIPIRHIARDLALSRNTLRRWVRGEQPELHRPRMHSLDPWRPVLERRWAEGCRNGTRLWRDLRDAGFKGGMRVVTEWASRQRLAASEGQPGPTPASATQRSPWPAAYPARRVARMLTSDTTLAEPDHAYVEQLLALSPTLATVRDLALRFGALVRAHSTDALTPWLADAEDSELRGFAAGLRQDEQAVRAALTLPWSSGQVEGQITRLKLVKRQSYGRAKLDLLRARLVHAA
jgi:transposase